MLSVCIPVYNYKIRNLINSLDELLKSISIRYEILVIDDCSDIAFQEENKMIPDIPQLRYIELQRNIGRAAIRNLLCIEARFENLIFMDCDVELLDNEYINKYLPYLNHKVVVCGGIKYQKEKPSGELMLRWKYGLQREAKTAAVRNQFPYKSFMTGNFLISKSILSGIPFSETLRKYGHEDTLTGIQLYQNEIPVIHIDNPVLHNGLEENKVFLHKTRESIENLCEIEAFGIGSHHLKEQVTLLKTYYKFKRYGLTLLISILFKRIKPLLIRQLCSADPSLFLLDVYKLGTLCQIKSQK